MTYHVPTQHAQARFTFTVQGIISEMGFTIGFATPTDDAAEAAATLAGRITTDILNFGANMSDGWVYTGVSVAENVGGPGPEVAEVRVPIEGTGNNLTVPCNCCILVRKNTAFGGRRNRGRIYMPAAFMPEITVDQAGFFDQLTATAWDDRWEDFRVGCVAADLLPVLFHQYDTDAPPDPLPAPTLITSFTTQTQLATQRNRMR